MNILLIGSGGREHALAWKLIRSPRCNKLYIAPGNAGTDMCGENIALDVLNFSAVAEFVRAHGVGMVVVGPEEPLVKGISDYLLSQNDLNNLLVIGPGMAGAQLEGSKDFSKEFMQRHKIPTARYRTFQKPQLAEAIDYVQAHKLPVVLKADGLAAGKGVVICFSHQDAVHELKSMLRDEKFGAAGEKVVIEEFLSGIEVSVFALTDGRNYVLLPEAKDYKRIGEGDTGLNTGGMGAVSPVIFADNIFMEKVRTRIIEPTVQGLINENIHYCGFLFFGLIKVNGEPYVIEYNCRMGDPETEVVIPRINNDLIDLFEHAARGTLNNMTIDTDPRHAVTVVAVSGGYPGKYEKGKEISGINADDKHTVVFHAGTTLKEGNIVTSGGRVLAVTSRADKMEDALLLSYAALKSVNYEGINYRKDIGLDVIKLAESLSA